MDQIEEIRARAVAASAGSWRRHVADVWLEDLSLLLFRGRDGSSEIREQADLDAEFVANARDNILALMALLDGSEAGGHSQIDV